MNLLDLVPMFKRQVGRYLSSNDTDSTYAAYIADAIMALNWRWSRDYVVTTTAPMTFEVEPEIAAKDYRPIILMASIIYKSGTVGLASYRDGDFAYDPTQGRLNPLSIDLEELESMVPAATKRLATGITAPLRGFANIYSVESYRYFLGW